MATDINGDISSEDETLSIIKQRSIEKRKSTEINSKHCDGDEKSVNPERCIRLKVKKMAKSARTLKYRKVKVKGRRTTKPEKQSRKYYCLQCESIFDLPTELKKHASVHQVETRHKCEDCGRCFDKAFSLKMHKKVHESTELKCPLCDLVFMQKSNLGLHLMSHERQEQCPSCPDKFHTKEQLRAHSRSHDSPRGIRHRASKKLKRNPNSVNTSKNIKDIITENAENHRGSSYNEFENCLKREELSHSTQCAIISKMHKSRCISDICRLYNVTPEVINEIWEDREKYSVPKKIGKQNAKHYNNIIDGKILEWFNEQRTNLRQVTGRMLRDKAEEIAKDVGFVQFNGSVKWLDRFKARYKITLRGQQVKIDLPILAFESKWKKAFFNERWSDARLGFTDDDIYSADEVGIYFNPSKGRIKNLYGNKFVLGSVEDRFSIFMCTNATGSDKKKLLVCGVEDPLKHSYRDPDTLPVNYIRHSQSRFTSKMFEEYVKYWNMELQRLNRKALLIIDQSNIHTKIQPSHLKICFVSGKDSEGLIPIRNGIYVKFRDEFRRLILEEKAVKVLNGIDRQLTCKEALYIIEKAWERTSPEAILNSFKSTGYDVNTYEYNPVVIPKVKENDDEEICRVLKDYDVEPYFTDLSELGMYLTVDEDLVTEGTNCSVFEDDNAVSELLGAEEEMGEILPISTEKPETDEKESAIKRYRALEDLEIVRNYLRTTNTSYEIYSHFMEVENFVYKTPL